jgi:hypothetical protein
VARIRGLPRLINHLDATLISLPIKIGGLGILSYKMVVPRTYATASEAADLTPAPILTTEALPTSTQPVRMTRLPIT